MATRHVILMSALLAATAAAAAAPTAAAQEVCQAAGTVTACAAAMDTGRFRFVGAYAHDESDGSFAGVGYSEGSGFFGNTAAADAFVYSAALQRYGVVIVAFNDMFPSDGVYEYGGVVVASWMEDGSGAFEAYAGFSDSDWDGQPDAEGVFHGAGTNLLP